MRLGEELVGALGVDPDDQAAQTAGCDRHIAANEEGETSEHPLLDDIALSGDQLTNAVGEILVVHHASIIVYRRRMLCHRRSCIARQAEALGSRHCFHGQVPSRYHGFASNYFPR
jgi:hypothetical protein